MSKRPFPPKQVVTCTGAEDFVILAVAINKQVKKQPEKNSDLNGNQTHDLVIPVQSSIHLAIKPHGYEFIQ